jgi:hypothetical protein
MPLRDGQEKVFRSTWEGGSGKVVWHLIKKTEEQIWQVRITGFEVDNSMKPSKFKDTDGKVKVHHKRMRFEWELTGRFKLSRKEGSWIFESGSVESAKVTPVADFVPPDIYQYQKAEYASKAPISSMVGEPIMGDYFGGSINLHWPPYEPEGYVKCSANHPAFPKTPYEGWFRSADFTTQIGLRSFPLKDGFSDTVTKKQWLRYTISFKRFK